MARHKVFEIDVLGYWEMSKIFMTQTLQQRDEDPAAYL